MYPIYIVLYVSSLFILSAVVLPMVHSSYWVFRVFEYPRFQKLVLACVIFIAWLFTSPWNNTWPLITTSLLFIAIVYLLYKITPYTPLHKREMKSYKQDAHTNNDDIIKILGANVLQENTNYKGFLNLIAQMDPHIVFLLETDEGWDKGMMPLKEKYPHCIKKIYDNTYGMIFYSKLPVVKSSINYLAEDKVPSLHLHLQMPNEEVVEMWGLHPKPPLPSENKRSEAKDKELMKVAFKARESKMPIIVMGDLNDVAWSHTTELFRKTSQLLDPRRGRGFYSTFNAKHWYMRFPLDYIFASSHFTLVKMKRLSSNGSDHFPIYTELHFSNADKHKQEKPKADSEELEDAAEISNKSV